MFSMNTWSGSMRQLMGVTADGAVRLEDIDVTGRQEISEICIHLCRPPTDAFHVRGVGRCGYRDERCKVRFVSVANPDLCSIRVRQSRRRSVG
jgi:hypothetical protein